MADVSENSAQQCLRRGTEYYLSSQPPAYTHSTRISSRNNAIATRARERACGSRQLQLETMTFVRPLQLFGGAGVAGRG